MFSKIVYFLSFGVFGYIVYSIINDESKTINNIPSYFLSADLRFILLAFVLQFLKYLVLSYNFYINFRQIGLNFTFRETLKSTFVYLYVSVATPFVGAGGLLAFVDYAGHKNFNRVKAGAGAFLALLADYIAFFLIILFSLVFYRDSISDFPVNYLYSMVGFGSILLSLVLLSIFTKDFLIKFIHTIQRFLNLISRKIHKRLVIDERWAHTNVTLAHECFVDIKHNPKFYLKPIGIGLVFHLLNILTLLVVTWSFNEAINSSKTISTYVVINTLETISPTPNGIGLIEALVPKFMEEIGIDSKRSLIIVTVFRVIYFYIPVLIGFYLSHRIFIRKQ
jgi:uncharacterized protein (TIRG00374 family)